MGLCRASGVLRMLNFTHIPDLSGWSAPGDGTVLSESVRLDFVDGTSRQATAAEILAARQLSVIEQINAEASRRILSAYPLEKQSSANLGIYPQAYTDKMITDIAAVIQASNDACDLVTAAVDIAGVEAAVVNWPVIGV